MKTLKLYGAPGCGKTHTMLEYFEEELKIVKPEKIGFLTFTRTARLEALSRASKTEDELPYVKTIHATCYKALHMEQSQLVMRKDLIEFGRTIGVQLTGMTPDLFSVDPGEWKTPTAADRLLQLNHLGRHRGLKLRDAMKDAPLEFNMKYAKWFTTAYRSWKTATCKRDYTDLLTDYLEMGDVPDLDVMFIDEAQDLSWLQWQVARKLWSNCQRVYLCGDDDQCIFKWDGASASLFNLEPADEVRVLPQSYRLPRVVHELGQKVIRRVKVRQPKEFKPRDAEGEYKPVGYLDSRYLNADSTLILYRNFHRGTALSLQLEEFGVPFAGANSTLAVQEVRDTISGIDKAAHNEIISLAEARAMVVHVNMKYLKPNVKERVDARVGTVDARELFTEHAFTDQWYRVFPKLPRLPYLTRAVTKYGFGALLNPTIKLLSIHQSKGREAHTVILDTEMARRTYEAYLQEPDDEHRCWYVAVTRAKERLLTLLPTESQYYQL